MTGMPSHAGISRRAYRVALACVVLLFVVCAYAAAHWRAAIIDRAMRAALLHQAQSIAQTIDVGQARALTFTAADAALPEFQRLRAHLIDYHTIIDRRGIYSLAPRDGELVFGPESYAPDDPQASPPGTVYLEPSEQDWAIFETARGFTGGPWDDEYGTFVSALAPVFDPRSGQVLMAIGLDVEATAWRAALNRERLKAVFVLLPLPLILCGGLWIVRRRDRWPRARRWLRYAETITIAAFGLALTLIVALTLHDAQARTRQETFRHLTEMHAALVLDAFNDLRDHRLKPLAAFFAGSEHVTRDEFRAFATLLEQRLDIRALEWVQPVPAAHKAEWEAQARAEGARDFVIWQHGEAGARVPAAGREVLYPVWYVEPPAGNEAVLGYDLGSEAVRRAALETAMATGLPTATDPLALVQDEAGATGLLAFAPVFDGEAQTQHGLVLAVFHPEAFLRSALFAEPGADAAAVVEVYQIEAGQPPRYLAASWGSPAAGQGADFGDRPSSLRRPLFAFGKTYAMNIYPGPAFLAANPLWHGWVTALSGLLLTVAVTAIAATGVYRRTGLETLVQARTAELRATLYSIGDAVIATDMTGHVTQMNPVAEQLTGWTEDEARGQPLETVFCIINEDTRVQVENPAQRVLRDGKVAGLANHTLLIARNGAEQPIADSAAPICDESGTVRGVVLVFRDQNKERAVQRALQESEARFRRLAENAQDLIFRYKFAPQRGFTYVSPAATAITGYTPEEHYADPDLGLKLVHPDDRPVLEAYFQGGGTFDEPIVLRWVRKDGQIIWAEQRNVPIYDNAGTLIALEGIARDVTERTQFEETLAHERNLLRTLIDNLPDLIFAKDLEGRFVLVNQASLQTGRQTMDDIIDKSDFEIHPPELAARYYADDQAVMHSGQPILDREEYNISAGQARWFSTTKVPLRDGEGQIIGLVGMSRDITARKQAEAQLAEQLDELRRWHAATLGREGRVIELKREVNALLAQAGQPPRYPSVTERDIKE